MLGKSVWCFRKFARGSYAARNHRPIKLRCRGKGCSKGCSFSTLLKTPSATSEFRLITPLPKHQRSPLSRSIIRLLFINKQALMTSAYMTLTPAHTQKKTANTQESGHPKMRRSREKKLRGQCTSVYGKCIKYPRECLCKYTERIRQLCTYAA